MNRAELADFEPSDGHLHACPRRGAPASYAMVQTNLTACDCAALLYCIAEDQSIALHRARTLLNEARECEGLQEWLPDLCVSIDEYVKANP